MSRTDVHTPGWVKQKDPLWRDHYQVQHDHSLGPCDLIHSLESRGWIRTSCYMNIRWQGQQIHCGCKMCTNQIGRKLGNRRDRHQVKNALRKGSWDLENRDIHRREAWVTWNFSSRFKRE